MAREREQAQTSWDYLVLSVLAFAFLFLVLFFASDGRVLEMVERQFASFAELVKPAA
jgi:hypothetical protein